MLAFRPARANDAEPIVILVNSAYRGDGSRRGWTTEADLLGGQRVDAQMVLEMIEGPSSRVELAFLGTELTGCVHLRQEPGGRCYLGMLTVDPARQAAGLGSALLSRSEELARGWGCAVLRMTVIDGRLELIAFYERRGYRRTGATRPFPEDDPRFGEPKTRGLRFIELAKPLGVCPSNSICPDRAREPSG